jgi:GTPase SAR1 family protein
VKLKSEGGFYSIQQSGFLKTHSPITMYMIRLLIVGETGVGKTSLLIRFNEGHFYADQKTTIGVDYKAKELDIDGETVKLQVTPQFQTSLFSLSDVNIYARKYSYFCFV